MAGGKSGGGSSDQMWQMIAMMGNLGGAFSTEKNVADQQQQQATMSALGRETSRIQGIFGQPTSSSYPGSDSVPMSSSSGGFNNPPLTTSGSFSASPFLSPFGMIGYR